MIRLSIKRSISYGRSSLSGSLLSEIFSTGGGYRSLNRLYGLASFGAGSSYVTEITKYINILAGSLSLYTRLPILRTIGKGPTR